MTDPADTSAILRRRAALIASALSGLTILPASARAQTAADPPAAPPARSGATAAPDGPCTSGAAPTEEDRAVAKERLGAGLGLQADGRLHEAAAQLRAAYERVPAESLAVQILDVDLERGAYVEAFELGTLHQRCFGPVQSIAQRVERARLRTTLVRLQWDATIPPRIELDHVELPMEQAVAGFRVLEGEHHVSLSSADGAAREQSFTARGGEEMIVSLAPLGPPPGPCLQPPWYPDPLAEEVLRLQCGVMAPLVAALAPEPTELTGGTGLFEELAGQAAEGLWLQVNLFQAVTFTEDVAYGLVGGGIEAEYRFAQAFGVGLGFAGGALITPEDSPRAAGFFGPVLIPASFVADLFYLEARIPIWLSPVVGFEPKAELGMLAPHIVVGIGGPVLREGDSDSAVASGEGLRRGR